MKKVTLIGAFLFPALMSFAQFQIGAQIGGNIGYQRTTVSQATKNSSKLAGFVLGAVAEMKLKNKWNFRPEFNYTQKTFLQKNSLNNIDLRGSLYYLEVPMNVTYNMNAPLGKVFIGAGPSIGYGVYGKITEAGEVYYPTFDGKSEGFHYKRFDFGVNFVLGYKLNSGSFVTLGYNNGLTNINTSIGKSTETRNKAFVVKFGYMLWKKKK